MSLPQQTISRLRDLRLHAVAEAYGNQLSQPSLSELGFDDRFALIVEHAAMQRESSLLSRLVKRANFPQAASLEDVDYQTARGLDRSQVASLANCDWIKRQLNLAIIGPTGVGKSFLACAIGVQACRMKLPTLFWRGSDLWEEIATAEIDGSFKNLRMTLVKPSLLIIDDLGIGELSVLSARVLLDVVERRAKTGSMLITSQYPIDKWHSLFPDPTIADALLDRIVHRAHKITLKGDSMRKIRGRQDLGDL